MSEKIPQPIDKDSTAPREEALQQPVEPEMREAPVARDYAAEAEDVQAREAADAEKLLAVQQRLGMTAEDTPKKDIASKQLQTEAAPSPRNDHVQEDHETVELQRNIERSIGKISEDVSRFGRLLMQRDDEGLSPLLENSEARSVATSGQLIGDSMQSGKIDFQKFSTALHGVEQGLKNYAGYRSGVVRENENNLRGLETLTRTSAQELYKAQKLFYESPEQNASEIADQTGRLAKRFENIWRYNAERTQRLSQYSR